MKYMKIVLGIALLVASLQAGITVMPKNEQKLDFSYYSEKYINIITPIGAISDTNDSARIVNTIFGNLVNGIVVLNNAKFNICGDQTHVLSIGINKYRYSNQSLKYAVEDAKMVPFMIQKSCPKSSIEVLLDEVANENTIRNTLKSMAKDVTQKDTVVIYYSGHGTVLDGKKVILPSDMMLKAVKLRKHEISLKSILSYFKATHAKVFIFADACFRELNLPR